uniref:MAK10-like protein n=1 Tax=Tanacetum cinerariifolium TaxID=118510 RepID=A0A6L2N242_TANCI|nr:MAK10-like protein [Tanacetum cinerariifolium]
MDFAKSVKAIALPQDVPSTSDHHLIELENQVQRLMEAYLAPTQLSQVNKITTSCEICSGPHDTQYCLEDPEQAFVDYASSRIDEAGGLVFEFMASQDARLSKFKADFKQQQSEMTNKIDTMLKAITDRIAGTLPSDMVKKMKLGTHPVLSACSYLTMDPYCSMQIHTSINAITIQPKQKSDSHDDITKENGEEERDSPEIHSNSSTPPDPSISFLTEKEDGDVMFIEIIPKDDVSRKEEREAEGQEVDYFDIFLTRSELAYHKFTKKNDEVAYKMPHKIEQYNSLSNLKKEHTKSIYLRNEENKGSGVEYVMSKIIGFYKECLELGPEYLRGIDEEGEVT